MKLYKVQIPLASNEKTFPYLAYDETLEDQVFIMPGDFPELDSLLEREIKKTGIPKVYVHLEIGENSVSVGDLAPQQRW